MNKEYFYLSNEELMVINENKEITKRNIINKNMHNILLLKNCLEEINDIIYSMEKEKEEENIKAEHTGRIKFIITYSYRLAISVIAGSIIFSWSLQLILELLLGVFLGLIVNIIIAFIDKKRQIKHTNGTNKKLEKAYELKAKIEQKLITINKTNNKVIDNSINLKTNKVITLEESTPIMEEVLIELDNAYDLGYKEKTRKRVKI